jgi:Fe-S cluster biogenesis protein NfuA
MYIETETTPNPATLKFLPGERVMPSGTREFISHEEAAASPLAEALFDLGDVTGVLFGGNFVAVTAGPGTEWSSLKPQVVALLLDHFLSQNLGDDPADAEIVEQIKDLIETRVRPAVANDGGDITYRGFRDGVVYLKMQGACAGCPSSSATLKNGIESLLKHYVPEVSEVRAA